MARRGTTLGGHGAGRHRVTRRTFTPVRLAVAGTAVLAAAAVVTVAVLDNGPAAATRPLAHASTARSASHSATATPTTATPTTATSTPTPSTSAPTPSPSVATTSPALAALRTLVSARSHSSTSVAALDTTTGVTVSAGATTGMTTASAVKVELLESLLLKHQRAGTTLSSGELASVTAMIEHSDNSAAEAVFYDIGGHTAVQDYEDDLGLSTTKTVLGDDDLWGLTTTGATQQLVLLGNLVRANSPLDAAGRRFALSLMRNVEADQAWGVPVAATSGKPAVKNGWLSLDSDNGLWTVNSLGVVTVHGHTVLMAVMTQHNDSYADGITRVESLVRAAATAVRS